MATEEVKFQPKDYKSDQYVRWCPGCGDHAVLNCLHKAMAEVGVAPHNMAVISGIGCSSRLPYYMNTYGFHTIHGRGAAIVLFNNKIYGLTKGQYSPTSDRGFVSKSSPYGTVEDPFIPAELALGARGNFFARVIDVDLKNTTEVLAASARHKGASVTEVLVNCVIFNDGIHKKIVDKEFRADRTIFLRHGEKMLFGKDNEKGIVLEGLKLKAVTIGQDGYTLDDVLVHDAHEKDNTLHMMLAMMSGDMPVALGVIRDVDAPTYDEAVHQQIEEVQAKNPIRNLQDYLMSGEIWKVK